MDANQARLHRMRDQWCELDEAMLVTFQVLDPVGQWPWLSTHPRVMAAWKALTRPEHLADLEFRLAYFDGGRAMNDWAAEVTRKAIEVSRSRAARHAEPGIGATRKHLHEL
jgi:hypothetical protein